MARHQSQPQKLVKDEKMGDYQDPCLGSEGQSSFQMEKSMCFCTLVSPHLHTAACTHVSGAVCYRPASEQWVGAGRGLARETFKRVGCSFLSAQEFISVRPLCSRENP